jgi:hypothetical protein
MILKMLSIQFVLIVKVIQMKLMKAIDKGKTIPGQERDNYEFRVVEKQFQQSEEPKLEASGTHVVHNMIVFSPFHLTR